MNDKTHIKLGRYVVNFVPVLFICAMAAMCFGVQNALTVTIKENAALTKRLTASDLKKSEAERQLAANKGTPASPSIVIISPDGSKVRTLEGPKEYSSFQRDIVF
ncbi:hypothetical protein [Enterobacter sp. 638]|nr:hypothetical protein [Enterobacter sp. 638]